MKTNATLFWILAGFFVLADIAYIVWSLLDATHGNVNSAVGGQIEWVGTVAIGLSAVLSAFLAFYVGKAHTSQGGELPEDRLDANIEDGDAEQGMFAPWSWWPIMLAASLALMFLGLAVGVWIAFIGAALLLVSIIGWQYEFYRGFHAH